MKRSRFSEEQIVGILKEHQAGLGAKDLCRKHSVSDAAFYKWRAKFCEMEVSDAKKLKALEVENAKLKKLLAEQMMDVSTLKEMLAKNFCGFGLVRHWSEDNGRVCAAARGLRSEPTMAMSSKRSESVRKDALPSSQRKAVVNTLDVPQAPHLTLIGDLFRLQGFLTQHAGKGLGFDLIKGHPAPLRHGLREAALAAYRWVSIPVSCALPLALRVCVDIFLQYQRSFEPVPRCCAPDA